MENIELNPLIEFGLVSAKLFQGGDRNAMAAIVKESRKAVGFTQTEVATYLGISQSAFSKTEAGQLIMDAIQWFSFCELISVRKEMIKAGTIAAPKVKKPKKEAA